MTSNSPSDAKADGDLPFSPNFFFKDELWQTDSPGWRVIKGMVAKTAGSLSVMKANMALSYYLRHHYPRQLNNPDDTPELTFYAEGTPCPLGKPADCKVPMPDYFSMDRLVTLSGAKVPERVLKHASKKFYQEIKAGNRALYSDGTLPAGEFVAKALQGQWSCLPLTWNDKLHIIKMVFSYDLKTLYPEAIYLTNQANCTPEMWDAIAKMEIANPKLAEVVEAATLSYLTENSHADDVSATRIIASASLAVSQLKKRKRKD